MRPSVLLLEIILASTPRWIPHNQIFLQSRHTFGTIRVTQHERWTMKKRKRESLGPFQGRLLSVYEAICSICDFFEKRRIPPTLDKLSRTISSIAKFEVQETDLLKTCGVAPEIFCLTWVEENCKVEDYQASSYSKGEQILVLWFKKSIPKKKRTDIFLSALAKTREEMLVPMPIPVQPKIPATITENPDFGSIVSPVDVGDVLAYLKKEGGFYRDQVAHVHDAAKRVPVYCPVSDSLFPSLRRSLSKQGVSKFYSHQATGIAAAMEGHHVVISTSTSSGKSLVYNVPILQSMLCEPSSVAIYLFPTKALSNDQCDWIRNLLTEIPELDPEILAKIDGDTATADRDHVRKNARMVLTNPDLLHFTLLPKHRNFERIFRECKYVVIDEAHSYSGIFGCHVACVLRRFLRICHLHGSHPQFICCSATIRNPLEHFQSLVPVSLPPRNQPDTGNSAPQTKNTCVILPEHDKAPRGTRRTIFWNPPYITDNVKVLGAKSSATLPKGFATMTAKEKRNARLRVAREKSGRRSSIFEAATLLALLVRARMRTLVFVKSRKLSEIVTMRCVELLQESSTPELASKVCSYRAGYLPHRRRELEKKIFNKEVLGITATNALELGVNIGMLDVVILLGFPGSISSMYQQCGRAGRGGRSATIIYVAFDSPIDQFFMKRPEALLSRPVENTFVKVDNYHILKHHVLCSVHEVPSSKGNSSVVSLFGTSADSILEEHIDSKQILKVNETFVVHPSIDKPSAVVNLRTIGSRIIRVIDAQSEEELDQIELHRSFFEVHPGAVYLNQSKLYVITELDYSNRYVAYAKPSNVKYYTSVRDHTDVNMSDIIKTAYKIAHFGRVHVCTTVFGYRKHAPKTGDIFETVPLTFPSTSFSGFGVWVDLPSTIVDLVESSGHDYLGSVHGANHALLCAIPLLIPSERKDLGTECPSIYQKRHRPLRLILYDKNVGGVGISRALHHVISDLVKCALEVVSSCDCKSGCPSCVCDSRCPEINDCIDKHGAIQILEVVAHKFAMSND